MLRVRELKELLNNYPDDMEVCIEVDDYYLRRLGKKAEIGSTVRNHRLKDVVILNGREQR